MSDAARLGYQESQGSLQAALETSQQADAQNLKTFGSRDAYVQAHAATGSEFPKSSGGIPRSMISLTTDPVKARDFAGNGSVFTANVPSAFLYPQTLPEANESEYLILHMLQMDLMP